MSTISFGGSGGLDLGAANARKSRPAPHRPRPVSVYPRLRAPDAIKAVPATAANNRRLGVSVCICIVVSKCSIEAYGSTMLPLSR